MFGLYLEFFEWGGDWNYFYFVGEYVVVFGVVVIVGWWCGLCGGGEW